MTQFKSKFEKQTLGATSLPYEPIKVKYTVPATEHTYTPDSVWKDYWLELKGKLDAATRKKMLYIKQQYPEQKIVFVFQNPNVKINKKSPTTYKMWAEKNGFLVWTPAELLTYIKELK